MSLATNVANEEPTYVIAGACDPAKVLLLNAYNIANISLLEPVTHRGILETSSPKKGKQK